MKVWTLFGWGFIIHCSFTNYINVIKSASLLRNLLRLQHSRNNLVLCAELSTMDNWNLHTAECIVNRFNKVLIYLISTYRLVFLLINIYIQTCVPVDKNITLVEAVDIYLENYTYVFEIAIIFHKILKIYKKVFVKYTVVK